MLRSRRLSAVLAVAPAVLGCASSPAPASSAPASPVEPAGVQALDSASGEKLEIARAVCDSAVEREGSRLRIGCHNCPPFDAETSPPAGATDPPEFYELENLYGGSFTKPGAVERAAVFSGCEPHSSNWGGTLLLERRHGAWVSASYRSGFHPADCRVLRAPDARDRLVCVWQTTHQGSSHWMLDTYDFAQIAKSDGEDDPAWHSVFALDDNSASECWGDFSQGLVAGAIDALRVVPAESGAMPRVEIDIRFGREAPSEKLKAECAAREANPDAPVDTTAAVATQKRTLAFSWTAAGLVPDSASKAFIDSLGPSP